MEKQINEKIREIAQSVNEEGKMSISTISIFQSNIIFLIILKL